MENKAYFIRMARQEEWYDAMALAWKTFLKFEAVDYSERGTKSFQEFITDKILYRMFLKGVYHLYIALEEEKIVGLISLRNEMHISLLFVDEKYHRQGIGRRLIAHLKNVEKIHKLTVNASPYGVGFYHKIGFKDMGPKTEKDGIIYTPMILDL